MSRKTWWRHLWFVPAVVIAWAFGLSEWAAAALVAATGTANILGYVDGWRSGRDVGVRALLALHAPTESRLVGTVGGDGALVEYGIPSDDDTPTVWFTEPTVEVLCGECHTDYPCRTARAFGVTP